MTSLLIGVFSGIVFAGGAMLFGFCLLFIADMILFDGAISTYVLGDRK